MNTSMACLKVKAALNTWCIKYQLYDVKIHDVSNIKNLFYYI